MKKINLFIWRIDCFKVLKLVNGDDGVEQQPNMEIWSFCSFYSYTLYFCSSILLLSLAIN